MDELDEAIWRAKIEFALKVYQLVRLGFEPIGIDYRPHHCYGATTMTCYDPNRAVVKLEEDDIDEILRAESLRQERETFRQKFGDEACQTTYGAST